MKVSHCDWRKITKIIIAANAINAVGMSLMVLIAITITAPAKAPTTAAVMPSTNAFMLGFFRIYESKGLVRL